MATVARTVRRARRVARIFREAHGRTGSVGVAGLDTIRYIVSVPFIGRVVDPTIAWAAFALSCFETGPTIIAHERGEAGLERLGARVAVFCHFDRQGRIRDHTRHYLDALRAEGLDLVFVSNSYPLAPADLAWIRSRAVRLVFRHNRGYDFGAWRDAMAVCELPAAETRFLVIANDSVYGPVTPLGPVLDRIDFTQADVWSATDSWQHGFHLQSYFVAFGPAALHHAAFARFWRSVGNVRSKWWVVRRYELGLSAALASAGLRCKALWPYTEMIAAVPNPAGGETSGSPAVTPGDMPLNPTADLWQVLIEHGCPFLKRELLRKNPMRVVGVSGWFSTVGRMNALVRDLILRDLEPPSRIVRIK